MKIKTSLVLMGLLFLSVQAISQSPAPRQLPANRTTKPVKIDGLIDEEAWKDAALMTDLVEFRPTVGRLENPETKTMAYLMYNEEGIYFGGFCYERSRDSVATELSGRDGFGTNDYIGLIFDTYNDKQNGFEYFLTPLGEQWDAKMTNNGEDFSWSAVWSSNVVMHKNGWSFEMFIPYSAIRFGKQDVQNWGMNITRRRRKTEQQYTWNPIDPNVNGFLTQEGLWTGISNIKPPLRLQFSPYFSTYVNHDKNRGADKKDWVSSVNGGMDVKYGINQAFTLDLTLIPDFGQVQSDNRILNLTPFEVRYTENRPFFTEGTELFSKGNLFYSRRIGKDPTRLHFTSEYRETNEKAIDDPAEPKLINAIKVSGRTQKGLGVGVLNAVTNHRYVEYRDTITGIERRVPVDPLTNYNIIVLDQTLKNNSSISLVNTNVWRSGSDYDANVTAALFSFNDKKNMWNVNGKFANSRLIGINADGSTRSGYNHSVGFGKTSGRFNFNLVQELTDDKFSSRDMGFFNYGNTFDHSLWVGYRWIKPKNWYNNIYLNFNVFYSRQLKPSIYRSANINMNVNGQLKNLWYAGALIGYEPHYNDFFEARQEGKIFRGWTDWFVNGWFETNSAKKYSFYAEMMYIKRSLFGSERYSFFSQNRYRFSDKVTVSYNLNLAPQNDNTGFAGFENGETIMGRRDIKQVENILNFKYSFNAKMNINVRLRHYWTKVIYNEFFTLLDDGSLGPNNTFKTYISQDPENLSPDQNYNVFNVDAVYTWQFAPGSFINLVWKNWSDDFHHLTGDSYFKNFRSTMRDSHVNDISFKVIYFLDYLQLKGWKKKKAKA